MNRLNGKKEKIGWMILVGKSMKKMWDNEKDDKEWKKFLDANN